MSSMRRHPLSLVLAFALAPLGLAACAETDPVDGGVSGASQWAAARALWHIDRDPFPLSDADQSGV